MLSWNEITIRLLVAAILGAIIGLERERKDWAAGMRTHMMVCVGAALTMMVSAFGFSDRLGPENIVLDPSRIAAQVISGIGFIGAGTILLLRQGVIRGLTTASGLWTVAAIGLAAGGGMYFAASVTTVLAIFILWILQPIERRISKRFRQKSVKILTSRDSNPSKVLKKLLKDETIGIVNFSLSRSENGFTILLGFDAIDSSKLTAILNDMQDDSGIKEVLWIK
jgi:putative Mg2+ transporter-C (MgtC) family protein